MDPNETPRVFSERYELNHLIARGGMAEVYRAHDRLLDRPVALKVLFPELSVDRSFVERFRREAQAAANLSHPNIVPVFDWGEDTGTYFIVMEYIDGRPLSSILKSAGPLSPERTADIGAHVAAALGYAHKHGVVHRDVKPGNVLITDDGQVKVTDFGIARAVNTEESLTQTGAVMGTATYFSPEQAEGLGVDSRSDIYSLGVVLFEMVTGRPPFLGDSPVAVASKHVRDHPPGTPRAQPADPADLRGHHPQVDGQGPGPPLRHRRGAPGRPAALQRGPQRPGHGRHHGLIGVAGATTAVAAAAGMDATRAVGAVGATGITPPSVPRATCPDESGHQPDPQLRHHPRCPGRDPAGIAGYFLGRNLGYFGGDASFNLPNVVGQQAAGGHGHPAGRRPQRHPGPAGLERRPGHGHLDQSGAGHPGQEG